MLKVNLVSVMVNDQNKALKFYTEVLGFQIKRNVPMGPFIWLVVVSPADPDGVEILLEPTGHPASVPFQKALYDDDIPVTSFASDDVVQEFERLQKLGVKIKSGPERMGTTIGFVIDDTCGNYIQIVQG